jgi:hypothetical protein
MSKRRRPKNRQRLLRLHAELLLAAGALKAAGWDGHS